MCIFCNILIRISDYAKKQFRISFWMGHILFNMINVIGHPRTIADFADTDLWAVIERSR